MRVSLQVASWVALGATILPAVLLLANRMNLEQTQWIMLAGTLGWFLAAPLWIGRKVESPADNPITHDE